MRMLAVDRDTIVAAQGRSGRTMQQQRAGWRA